MKNTVLYAAWGGLFLVCCLLGCIPEPQGLLRAAMIFLSVLFFVPGGWLLYRGLRGQDRAAVVRIRLLSALSLGLTLTALVANFAAATAGRALGDFLYGLLVIVSTPMICSRYWILSLFLWGCLLFGSFLKPTEHNPKDQR